MRRGSILVASAMALSSMGTRTSWAQEAPPPPAAAPAERDGSADGGEVTGVVLMVVGAGVVAVGATILVIDAASAQDPEPTPGLDLGLGGERGRAGQETAGEGDALATVGVLLLGGGAIVHLLGVGLWASSGDEEEPAPQSLQPVVGPGFGALRGTF